MLRKSVAKATSKIGFKPLLNTQQYNLSSNQEKGLFGASPQSVARQHLHGSNFITLSQIPDQEKIEIIKTRNGVPSEQREQDFNDKLREQYP